MNKHFSYNYTRSFTQNLLKSYDKPKRHMISQSVLVLIITQFFLILPANSGQGQYYNRGLTNSSKSMSEFSNSKFSSEKRF